MTRGTTFLGKTSGKSSSPQRECKLSNVDDCCPYVLESALPIPKGANTASESCSRVERVTSCNNLYMTQKNEKSPRKVPNDPDSYAANNSGNLNSHTGKESNHHMRKRVEKKSSNVSNLDFSQVHDGLNVDALNKKLPNAVDAILLSKSADTNQEKLKVPKDLTRNKSPGSLQEPKGKCVKGSPVSGACFNCTMQLNVAAGSAGQVAGARSLGDAGSQSSRNMEETMAFKFLPHILATMNVVTNAGQNIKASPGVTQVEKLRKCNTCTAEEECKDAGVSNFLIPEVKSRTSCGIQNDSRCICWAVNEAHRAQLASEAIEKGKGYPVAEFEKLLHSASPVLCPSINTRTCQACPHGQDAPLCRHEIPNISLGSLWQWYEKHGSYGLEVKAEDRRSSKRFGIDRLKFRAYFVPLLSAVQLFKYHRSPPIYKNGTLGSIEVLEAERNKKSEISPVVDLHSILSVLVPQPRVVDSSSLPKKKGVSDSMSSSDRDTDSHHPPVDSKLSNNKGSKSSSTVDLHSVLSVLVPQPRVEGSSSFPKRSGVSGSRSYSDSCDTDSHHPPVDSAFSDDDLELLFEYFEHEQPQSRKPLFEKIQELIAADGPSSCGAYGDPSILQSVRLADLHPHSWFSVAWYPIYMIPSNNLRAAFLTYHSLGHYVDRRQSLDARNLSPCVVSPIVGLQSYNAQGECWFQPRHSTDHLKEVSLDSDPLSVLRDRLKTLEQTASIMSRAVRTKGGETLVNKHPDYEFFLSRRS